MWTRNITLLGILLMGACAADPEAEIQYPKTIDELTTWVSETDALICDLPLEQIENHESLEANLKDYLAFIPDTDFELGKSADQVKEYARRAALRRRVKAGAGAETLAASHYLDLGPRAEISLAQLEIVNGKVKEQQAREDTESPDYHIRFCVLNEARADLLHSLRSNLLEKVDAGILTLDTDLIKVFEADGFYAEKFQNAVYERLISDGKARDIEPLTRARLHRPQSPILPFDPKTSEAFWVLRDEEIDVFLDHIETHTYDSSGERLEDMKHIDQTFRSFWGNAQSSKNHFENAAELELFKSGISERVQRIDAFNTKTLAEMLKTRDWFRDDEDGHGAASNAWLIAQHADRNPDFQIEALERIERNLGNPGVSARNYAYLYDRVGAGFMSGKTDEERLQRYGTQGRCTDNDGWQPIRLEEPDRVDELRAEVGLEPIANYKKRFTCSE